MTNLDETIMDEDANQDSNNESMNSQYNGHGEAESDDAGSDLLTKIEAAQAEAAEFKDKYLRAHAEMENMRKRLEREKTEIIRFSNETLLKEMIPVLDSLDKAVQNTEAQGGSYVDGMRIVHKQMLTVLAKHGLEPIVSLEAPFDPNVHQAIRKVESAEVTSEQVEEEYAKGYTLFGRLVRPAMVSVKVPAQ